MIPMEIIATIRSDFPTKFGIPRQSGLVEELRATVVFEPEYRSPDALRGAGGLLPPLAHLAVLRGRTRQLVAYRAPTQAGRQPTHGRVCHTLSFSA